MDALPLMATRRHVVRGHCDRGGFVCVALSVLLRYRRPRVIVIGGGFGGASCARALRKVNSKLKVTLVEPNRIFTACPFSNEVIAGLRDIEAQQFGYEKIAADGVSVIAQAATRVDPQAANRWPRRRNVACLRPAGAGAGHRPQVRCLAGL